MFVEIMEYFVNIKTPEQAKTLFEATGVAISDWAKENGFKPEVVYSLLAGRLRGKRGHAHKAAVALGLKAPPPVVKPIPTTENHQEVITEQ